MPQEISSMFRKTLKIISFALMALGIFCVAQGLAVGDATAHGDRLIAAGLPLALGFGAMFGLLFVKRAI